jgi:penicillin-binding protein activator
MKEKSMSAHQPRNIFCIAALSCLAIGLTGCGSQAHYVDTDSPNTVVTVHGIDPQDWNRAGSLMVQSLLNSGVLSRAPRQPAVMAISRIKNETSENVDIDLLVKNIRVALLNSGKVVTSTTVGLGGHAEDPLAKGTVQQEQFYSGTEHAAPDLPDYTLSGKIIEEDVQSGDTRQSTYTFQLSLTDKSGNAVWEDQKQITKQGDHSGVGW